MSENLELREQETDTSGAQLPASEVEDLLGLLAKAIRAHQLYQANSPVRQKFVAALADAFSGLWNRVSALRFQVDESALRWGDRVFPMGDGRDNLAFLFYKDGIRQISFLHGFEEEVDRFLDLVNRARQLDRQGDDLVTLLWEQDFAAFRYTYVDVLAEGLNLPETDAFPELQPIALDELKLEAGATAAQAAAAPAALEVSEYVASVTREDFEETLYFLDPAEMRALQEEVEREIRRDLKADVLNALLDRLEDSDPGRQREILGVFRQLLPIFLARGDLRSAGTILTELDEMQRRGDVLGPHLATDIDRLFEELSNPANLQQLVQTIEGGAFDPDASELSLFLAHLRPAALPILLHVAETTDRTDLRDLLHAAVDRLAGQHTGHVVELLGSNEAPLAAGAARLVGRLRLTEAAEHVARLLRHPEPSVRRAAVDALLLLRTALAMEALQGVLEDPDREVRLAAVRGLGSLRYQPARARLERLLMGRLVRDADLTEKIAFFEAYGSLGGGEAVAFLDGILNGRGLLGRKQPAEFRACAALALGRVPTPAARAALQRAAADPDPVVRNAVGRAMRQEATP